MSELDYCSAVAWTRQPQKDAYRNLPRVPTLISDPEAEDVQFDRFESVERIKRSLGADKLIGIEIFP